MSVISIENVKKNYPNFSLGEINLEIESGMIIEESSSSLGLAMIDFILTKTASINTYSISKDCLVVSTVV